MAIAIAAMLLGALVLEIDPRRTTMTNAAAAGPAPTTSSRTDVPGTLVSAPAAPRVQPADPVEETTLVRRGGVPCAQPHRTVQVSSSQVIRSGPNGRAIGTLPAGSKYLGQPMTAWVQAVDPSGTWGRVTMPWSKPVGRSGWVRLPGMQGRSTRTLVVADLSDRLLRVYRGCDELFRVSTAIGRPGSPSPTGRFWVTDRVAVPSAQQGSFGTFAFGMSAVQPNLPAGWTGGDQMAIHGTGAAGSIGEAASAGCLRVDERALARLRPLLRTGTPIVITA